MTFWTTSEWTNEAVWLAFERQVGSPGSDLRLLASLPQVALVTGCNNALTDNGPFSPIEATQVGLVWRLAKRIMAARSNVTEENFIDVDPWMEQQSRDNDPRGEQQQRASGSSGVKGKNFENECADRSTWRFRTFTTTPSWRRQSYQNYIVTMGSQPD